MRRPRPKTISRLVPELVRELFPHIILQEYQGKRYDDPPACPDCKSVERTRWDWEKRLFCIIITERGFQDISVRVKRYKCKTCGRVYPSRAPFYPDCIYASPVVDACLYLASGNTFCSVEHILMMYGLQIDRDTVGNYAHRFVDRAKEMAGIRVDTSSIAINLVRLLFDARDVEELKERFPGELFQDTGDETYPAIKGAKKRMREENTERALRGEPLLRYPASHTLGSVYEAIHKFHVSMLATKSAFNLMLADALKRPARGCVGSVRDGSKCYRGPHINCVNHKGRRMIGRDPGYRRLKKQAQSRAQIKEYCKAFYAKVREEEAERAAQMYPELVDGDGRFIGALSTNSMEGGNWRIKYGLGVPYTRSDSLGARALLLVIADSVKTFREGGPGESFAHIYGCFTYSRVMEHTGQEPGTGLMPNPHHYHPDDSPKPSKPSKHIEHTETFTLWLQYAVQRAQTKHREREATNTTHT